MTDLLHMARAIMAGIVLPRLPFHKRPTSIP